MSKATDLVKIENIQISREGEFLVLVKVGNDASPATNRDIQLATDALTCLSEFALDTSHIGVVTHHNVEVTSLTFYNRYLNWVKVGSEDRPASEDDISDVASSIYDRVDEDVYETFLFTPHCVTLEEVSLLYDLREITRSYENTIVNGKDDSDMGIRLYSILNKNFMGVGDQFRRKN